MKNAKTHRIFITIVASVMVLMFAMFAFTFAQKPSTASATVSANASSYFSGVSKVEFKDDMVVAEINFEKFGMKRLIVTGTTLEVMG